jgi:WD40 repeat protein
MYAFSSPPAKISVFETADNPLGLCCLGSKIVAFPGRTPGQVQLVELSTGNVSIIPAHSSPLRAVALSPDGETLATASEIVCEWSFLLVPLELTISRVLSYEYFPPATALAWENCAGVWIRL